MSGGDTPLVPFLKWAGGKRWLTERCLHLVPHEFDRYIEPFLGSGAMYFALRPKTAVLSDLNEDLIQTYEAVRSDPTKIRDLLSQHQRLHCKDYYYSTRSNKPEMMADRAAWLLYLNRTCWNGLYRVNKRNEFNVPIGTKTSVILPTDNFGRISDLLEDAEISCRDFEETIDLASSGDFLFVDPPYTVKHNFNGFIKYNDRIFSWSDQVRLREAIGRAVSRGAKALITNANHESIRELYAGLGGSVVLSRASVLAANSTARTRVEELAIQSWT